MNVITNWLVNLPLADYGIQIILTLLMIAYSIWYLLHSKSEHYPALVKLTPEEEDELIDMWEPEPLVPALDSNHFSLRPRIVTKYGKEIVVDGKSCLNLATHDYLNFVNNQECIEAAVTTAKKYGVGSCGPRGFFGTVDVHVELEKKIAEFMNTEEAILYSYGYSAISSAIPAYSKVNDVIFADENVNYAIQQGLVASRSKIRFFKHNDVADLAQQLQEQHDYDTKHKLGKHFSRFIIVEGLYMNTGDLCPLPEIIELKKQHKIRLFIDDSVGFGVLGEKGRGIAEHYNVNFGDIDMIAVSLEYACAAYGGFCTGTHFIIDHQRLSGLGYCFSASLPPLQAAVAIKAIELIDRKDCVDALHELCPRYQVQLMETVNPEIVSVKADLASPVKHIRFTEQANTKMGASTYPKKTELLEKVVQSAFEKGYALTIARYLKKEHSLPEPSIRLIVTIRLSEEEVDKSIKMLAETMEEVYNQTLNEI